MTVSSNTWVGAGPVPTPAATKMKHMMDNHDHIAQAEQQLSPDERDRLAKDEKRWKRMGEGGHLQDWLEFGPSLMTLRQTAMRIAFTNRPTGRPYTDAFRALVRKHFPGMDDDKNKSVSYVLWVHDEPERLQILAEQRQAMSPGQRSRLNTPKAASDLVRRVLKQRDEDQAAKAGVEIEKRLSPVEVRDTIIRNLNEENAALKAKLVRDSGGSLLDLKEDSAKVIGGTIVAHVSEFKASEIVKAIKAAILAKKKPAG